MVNEVGKVYTKRILFIGMPDMAIVCLNNLYNKKINIVGVIPPDKSAGYASIA